MLPLRVLCVIANPSDLPRFDEARAWREIEESLDPLRRNGSLLVHRLVRPTENALRESVAEGGWTAVHFVVHAQARAAVRYGAVALQSSDGHARNLTAAYLAKLLAGAPGVRLVVLQACDEASFCFDPVAEALVEHGVGAVVVAPPLSGPPQRTFVAKLYAGLLEQLSADAISKEVAGAVRVLSRNPSTPVFAMAAAAPTVAPVDPPPPSGWQEELKRKRASGRFDVFLCHNSADKPAVKRIGQKLKEAGVLPWLDVWELPPGQPWQPQLERQIGDIRSAAVFVGSAGMGPWQEQEMYGFLREFVARKAPVIPVLLPDAPATPDLPVFLRAMTWVDFRTDDPDPLKGLIWGVTGERPDD